MPLSDHEQRLLEQMEQALYAEDPKFASVLQGDDLRVRYRRRLVFAVLGFIAGVGGLFAGLAIPLTLVGVLGFVVMVVSVLAAVSAYNRTPRGDAAAAPAGGAPVTPIRSARQKKGLMDRVEERWQRRRDQFGR